MPIYKELLEKAGDNQNFKCKPKKNDENSNNSTNNTAKKHKKITH